jgi:hypothetical protein
MTSGAFRAMSIRLQNADRLEFKEAYKRYNIAHNHSLAA